jgi:hypothetical protein
MDLAIDMPEHDPVVCRWYSFFSTFGIVNMRNRLHNGVSIKNGFFGFQNLSLRMVHGEMIVCTASRHSFERVKTV